jgi:hypothetical protein
VKLLIVAASIAALTLQGCAAIYDPRDRPWDPKQGRALFEQIPAWDNAALRQCGGHMMPDEARREGRSMRC